LIQIRRRLPWRRSAIVKAKIREDGGYPSEGRIEAPYPALA
jgi:hypothetical protein